MIDLLDFQAVASEQIAERFGRYLSDRPFRGTERHRKAIPFYQALASITGSGKTVILADAIEKMRARLPAEPVVVWLSKGRIVVAQTFANLQHGGKYRHLISAFTVKWLSEARPEDLTDASHAYIYLATVGTFNQRDKERGDRLIYRSDLDTAEVSTWDAIKTRVDAAGRRRPLIVVYDEAHNLSDQQTKILLELEPDALLVASATMRLPPLLAKVLDALREEGRGNDDLTTSVSTALVADSGLIKKEIILGGYEAAIEPTIDALLLDMARADAAVSAEGISGLRPKAIYISKTNIVEGNALQRDDAKRPFASREAPPILIWRYLVEQKGVDPGEIAVYAALDFDRNYPPPAGFVLFKGGDKDYDNFAAGEYRHIIFNLALQEGWDDPSCYFAYIDRSMGSNVQVEQVIGRVLRQPGTRHYQSDVLNSAHFYVRVDQRGVFSDVLERVRAQVAKEAPDVRFTAYGAGTGAPPLSLLPKSERKVPKVYRDPSDALSPIGVIVDRMNDYRSDAGGNIRGTGARVLVQQQVGHERTSELKWVAVEHHNAVSARWVFQRAVLRQFPGALEVASSDDPKFDARVEFGSRAFAHIEEQACRVVDEYLSNVRLRQRSHNPYVVGSTTADPATIVRFQHSLHEGYSGLNSVERAFADELDRARVTWARNPPRSGFGIPLLTRGKTKEFYPDFLVWKGSDVFAIDTTGEHLLVEKTGRKLLSVAPTAGGARIFVRLVSAGKWNDQVQHVEDGGWTVWRLRDDRELGLAHFPALADAANACIAAEPRRS